MQIHIVKAFGHGSEAKKELLNPMKIFEKINEIIFTKVKE